MFCFRSKGMPHFNSRDRCFNYKCIFPEVFLCHVSPIAFRMMNEFIIRSYKKGLECFDHLKIFNKMAIIRESVKVKLTDQCVDVGESIICHLQFKCLTAKPGTMGLVPQTAGQFSIFKALSVSILYSLYWLTEQKKIDIFVCIQFLNMSKFLLEINDNNYKILSILFHSFLRYIFQTSPSVAVFFQ